MNRKGQIAGDVIYYLFIAIAIIIFGLIFLKMTNSFLGGAATATQNIDQNASAAFTYGQNKINSIWDTVNIAVLLIYAILVLLTAFLVNIHPAFSLVYVVEIFFTFFVLPGVLDFVNSLWGATTFAAVVIYLPMTAFILTHFYSFAWAVIVAAGVLMFVKFIFAGGQSSKRGR